MLWLFVSLLGLYMMARSWIPWKESGKAPYSATVEDRASYTEQMLSLHLSEKHYMFLLAVQTASERIECGSAAFHTRRTTAQLG
jgi:hypothetical protein